VDTLEEIAPAKNSFAELKTFCVQKNDWLFGFLSYDLKNETENLSSNHVDGIGFPQMHFFQPKYVFIVTSNKVEIGFIREVSSEEEVKNIFSAIDSYTVPLSVRPFPCEISARVSEEEYIRTINEIINHIRRGDIYELNYCMEFFSKTKGVNPLALFLKLNETSQAPFSAFYRMKDKYLMCASPERFLKKSGRKIISQPIKGTARRSNNISEDNEIQRTLLANKKERSENVMIVDLVRNDLSKTCDNVQVDKLCDISSFKQWHQLISTVSGEIRNDVYFVDVIKNTFPMGSMTGAPKIRAMELIEQFEKTKRGLYSGAVGYITPPLPEERGLGGEVDFDFNVVIRSILYNQTSDYLSFQVGSAITANSIPEKEYSECLLKAKGMFEALSIPPPKISEK
jgi:para-aminobenzoate synthetase component I